MSNKTAAADLGEGAFDRLAEGETNPAMILGYQTRRTDKVLRLAGLRPFRLAGQYAGER